MEIQSACCLYFQNGSKFFNQIFAALIQVSTETFWHPHTWNLKLLRMQKLYLLDNWQFDHMTFSKNVFLVWKLHANCPFTQFITSKLQRLACVEVGTWSKELRTRKCFQEKSCDYILDNINRSHVSRVILNVSFPMIPCQGIGK